MINGTKMRKWATPLTIGAFALSAISGMMMFFHLNSALVKIIHEWGSWSLVIGGLFHVVGSWQAFVRYFSKPAARTIMAVFALLIIAFFLPLGGFAEGKGKKLPPAVLSRALPEASFSTIANIAQHQPEELVKELELKGIVVKDKEETIHTIALRNNKQHADILKAIF
jgi:hypothetical protein